jgi:signal transduction histidine kinase/CheY-like chemotaxis protein
MRIQRKSKTIGIPLSWMIGLFFVLTSSLLYFYLAGASERNHQRFELEADGISRVLAAEGNVAVFRIKDVIAMIASGQEARVEEKLSNAVKRSKYIREVGHFRVGADFDHHHYLSPDTALTPDHAEVASLDAMLKGYLALTRVVLPKSYPRTFEKVSRDDVIFVQNVRDPERPGQDIIVYFVLDLKTALSDAIGLFSTSTRVKDIRVRVDGEEFKANFDPGAPDRNLFGERRETRRAVLLTRDTEVAIEFVEHFPGTARLIAFVIGLIVIFATASTLFVLFARSARISKGHLEEAVKRANAANEAKSDFLANMSHEIRTPLNGVLGLTEVLSRTDLSAVQRNYTQQILASGSLLLTILNDLLDMAKLESGQLSINPSKVELPFQLKETVSFYFAQAREEGLELVLDVAPDVPRYVQIDPMRLRQILGNLIGNAIKFTPKGSITVAASYEEVSQAAGSILVTVTDTGIGLTDEQQAKLFGRFVQATDDTARQYGGTGLGLAVCKKLCVAMGGDIAVTSSLGQGSTFAFWLPVVKDASLSKSVVDSRRIGVITGSHAQFKAIVHYLADAGYECLQFDYGPNLASNLLRALKEGPISSLIFDEERDMYRASDHWQALNAKIVPALPALILGETEFNRHYEEFDAVLMKPFIGSDLIDKLRSIAAASGGSRSTVDLHAKPAELRQFPGYRCLLVDDNQINLMVLEEIMERFGFTIETTTDGARSVTMAETDTFDLILMDCQMPVMNGFAATAKLRALMAYGKIKKVPIVAVTANALNGDREACLDAGMDDAVFKPISIQSMADVMDRLVEIGLLKAPPAEIARDPAVVHFKPAAVERSAKAPAQARAVASAAGTFDRAGGKKTATDTSSPPPPAAAEPIAADLARREAATKVPAAPAAAAITPRPSGTAEKVPLMDLAILKQTRDLVRNFDKLLSLYRSDTRTYLDMLLEQIAKDELADAVLPAHTIKSSSKIIGATGIASLAGSMETRLRTGEGSSPEELRKLLQRMEEVFDHTLRQLDLLEANGLLKPSLAQAS